MKDFNYENLFRGKVNKLYRIVQLVVVMAFICAANLPAKSHSSTEVMQSVSVSGTVSDTSGERLIGVNVAVKGTTIGVITDVDGNFTLNVPNTNSVLVFSFMGFVSQEVTVGSQKRINVTLQEDNLLLEEVVVIGYGSVKKSDLTGSVANVTADRSNKGGVSASVGQMIQGRVAGLNVTQNSAQPGGNNSIIIRGRNSINGSVAPLYVVDGFPYDAAAAPSTGETFSNASRDPMSFINPNDIETVSVLKDAAATAIYGTRGANGVIIITTKKGKAGKLKITYDGYAGVQEQAKKYELLSGPEYMTYWSQFTQGPTYTAEEIARATTTNWIDEVLQQGSVQSHQVSLSAAENNLRYYFSAGYYNQKGIVKNAEMQRMSVRSNVDYQKGKLGVFTNFSLTNINDQNQSDSGGSRASILESAISFAPNLTKPADGSYVQDPGSAMNIYPLTVLGVEDKTKSDKVDVNADINYEVLPGLKPQLKLGYNVQNAYRTYYLPSTTPSNGGVPRADGTFHNGMASATSLRNVGYTLEGLLNYSVTLANDLKVIALAGYSYQYAGWENNRTRGQEFSPADIFGPDNMNAATTQIAATGKEENVIISGFGRLDLTWKDKYFLTGTLRRDGSSKFGENNKWGWFPGASAAWKLNNESFLESAENLDLLKLRLGWGVTGNSGFSNYLSLPLYNVVKDNGAVIGQQMNPATTLSSTLANPNLQWEKTSQINLGVDVTFYKKYNLSVDFYRKNTSDLIIPLPLMRESGLSQQWVNAADLEVKGAELTFEANILQKQDFQWSTNFVFGWNDNKVTKINIPGEAVRTSLQGSGIIEGEKPNSYFMYKFKEVNADGVLVAQDLDNSGGVNVLDKTVVGSPDPDVTIGWGNTVSYKIIDLSFFFNSALGRELHNTIKAAHTSAYLATPSNRFKSVLTEANLPKTNAGGLTGGDFSGNSRWVEDASYLRLQNVTLTFNIPTKGFQNKIESLKLYVQGQNLWTHSKYSGVNPETNGLYPSVRTITGGLNITF
ncbi:MAG: TonB-dependent receptor [Tannerella sp.]|jgi:TonB-linked SusC/RagA family outer membrane protein|nr:TonB-dependent receptor [Tannerella sp.]